MSPAPVQARQLRLDPRGCGCHQRNDWHFCLLDQNGKYVAKAYSESQEGVEQFAPELARRWNACPALEERAEKALAALEVANQILAGSGERIALKAISDARALLATLPGASGPMEGRV